MAQNVTIAGTAYSNVPAVDLPKTGGGTARFYDTQGDKVLTPSLSEQTGVDVKSYATASVAAITKELLAQLDGDFVAENIKKDVDLFGLVGTLESGAGEIRVETGSVTFAESLTSYIFVSDRPDAFVVALDYPEPDKDSRIELTTLSTYPYIYTVVQYKKDWTYYSSKCSRIQYTVGWNKGTRKLFCTMASNLSRIGEVTSSSFNGSLAPATYRWWAIYGVTIA